MANMAKEMADKAVGMAKGAVKSVKVKVKFHKGKKAAKE